MRAADYFLESKISLLLFSSSRLVAMPLTLADATRLSAGHSAETAGPHGPPPEPRITMEGFQAIDHVVTPTCQLIMGIDQAPLVPNPSSQLRGDCDRILKRYAENNLRNSHKAPTTRFHSSQATDEAMLRSLTRPESATVDSTRPFVRSVDFLLAPWSYRSHLIACSIMFDPDVGASMACHRRKPRG